MVLVSTCGLQNVSEVPLYLKWFKDVSRQECKMPIQAPQWTEYLNCPICEYAFELKVRLPISISYCGHSICKACISSFQGGKCPFDQVGKIFIFLLSKPKSEVDLTYKLSQISEQNKHTYWKTSHQYRFSGSHRSKCRHRKIATTMQWQQRDD